VFVDGDTETTVTLSAAAANQTPATKLNLLYPHEVRIIAVDTNSHLLTGIFVEAIMMNTTIENTNWLTGISSLFGISPEATPINGTLMYGYTDSYGSTVFPMVSSGLYRLTFTNASMGVSRQIQVYPDQSAYTYVLATTATAPVANMADYITTNLSVYESPPNVYLNATYRDTGLTTSDTTFYVNYANRTPKYSYVYYANQTINASYAVSNIANDAYVWGFAANNTRFGWINQSQGITLKGVAGILYNPFDYKGGWY
jgi:hypothetical protein